MSQEKILRKQLEIFELVSGSIDDIEWSGEQQGPGSGPHSSGNDGALYEACPACGGLKEPNGSFIREAVGHRRGCPLKKKLKALKKLTAGEPA